MATLGFKKYSVVKIYFLFIKNIYSEAYNKYLKDQSRISKILISVYFFLFVIVYSPLLLIKIWNQRKKINLELEKKYRKRIFELLFNIKTVFPELSDENASFLSNGLGYGFLTHFLDDIFPKFQKISERLIENGWFINNYISIEIKGEPDESVYTDNFNINILRNNIKEIQNLAISRFPQRAEYLNLAFLHYHKKDYISSISIMLPQIDGIFRELTSKELFSKIKKKNPSSWINEIEESQKEGLLHFLLSPLKREEYFGANFSESLENQKFLSRNRILHGEDLELNDETKCFKVISLLLYIISIVYDVVYEDENNPRLKDYFEGIEELKSKLGIR